MARYGKHDVVAGNWVIAGRGDERDVGEIVQASSTIIEIAWDRGDRTVIDLTRYFVDADCAIAVFATAAAARAESRRSS